MDLVGCVSRDATGAWAESLVSGDVAGQPLRLPGLLGASARFIPDGALVAAGGFDDGVLRLDALTGDTIVGYVYGGILATQGNNGSTDATGRILEVHVSPRRSAALPVPAGVTSELKLVPIRKSP